MDKGCQKNRYNENHLYGIISLLPFIKKHIE